MMMPDSRWSRLAAIVENARVVAVKRPELRAPLSNRVRDAFESLKVEALALIDVEHDLAQAERLIADDWEAIAETGEDGAPKGA